MVDVKKILLYKEAYATTHVLEEELRMSAQCDTVVGSVLNKIIPCTTPLCRVGCILGQNVLPDIEMTESYETGDTPNANTVFNKLDMTKLSGSKRYLKALVSTPISQLATLAKRQALVKKLAAKATEIEPLIDILKKYEKDVAWLYEERDVELIHLYDMVYFKNMFLRPLNARGEVLTIHNTYRILGSPIVGIMTPILYFVIPYLILRYKLGLQMSFISYIKLSFAGMSIGLGGKINTIRYISYAFSLIFYFQGIFNSIELSKTVYQISKLLTNKIQGVLRFIQAAKKLNDMLYVDNVDDFGAFFTNAQDELRTDIDMFTDVDTYHSFSIFSNYGRSLRVYKYLDKTAYLPLLNRAYMIDTVMSIHRTRIEHGFSFPEYVEYVPGEAPVMLSLRGTWHPCLNKLTAVRNDIVLGHPNNALLTGPNAGGKSTLLKSILIAVVLSQTLGISNTELASMTPFVFINSQINVPDCKGKESLFEAEMYRSKSNFDTLRKLGDKPSIIVMDEIFNSTNPVEGIAGAYAIAKNLAAVQSNISIISTHYLYLTKLAKDLPHAFVNYKMNVKMDTQGNLVSYPYKLSKGVSRQYVALELLKRNGFDEAIIMDALQIKTRLVDQAKQSQQQKMTKSANSNTTIPTTDTNIDANADPMPKTDNEEDVAHETITNN